MNWKSFAKSLIPALVGALLALADMVTSGQFDLVHERALAAGIITAIAVYLTPNQQPPAAGALWPTSTATASWGGLSPIIAPQPPPAGPTPTVGAGPILPPSA